MLEYYPAFKRILTLAPTWMDLEDMMLSEISQMQKDKCHLIPLPGGPRGVRSRDRKWMVGPGAGGGDGESVFRRDRISVWKVEKVLEIDSGDEGTMI